jgi:hypothetical protein
MVQTLGQQLKDCNDKGDSYYFESKAMPATEDFSPIDADDAGEFHSTNLARNLHKQCYHAVSKPFQIKSDSTDGDPSYTRVDETLSTSRARRPRSPSFERHGKAVQISDVYEEFPADENTPLLGGSLAKPARAPSSLHRELSIDSQEGHSRNTGLGFSRETILEPTDQQSDSNMINQVGETVPNDNSTIPHNQPAEEPRQESLVDKFVELLNENLKTGWEYLTDFIERWCNCF